MTHYICTGVCNGVSDKPGVCQAADCPKRGKPLEACLCADSKHAPTTAKAEEKKERMVRHPSIKLRTGRSPQE